MTRILKGTAIVLSVAFLGAVLMNCGGGKKLVSERPEWVDRGGGFFSGERGKAFYGVGAVSNISSVSLRRSTADAQARVDLARVFQTNVKNLLKAYTASTSAGDPYRETVEQHVQEVTKAFTGMDLSGSQIIDRWYDPVEKTQYALAVLDLALFKEQVTRMRALSAEVRDAIRANAARAFEELEEAGRHP